MWLSRTVLLLASSSKSRAEIGGAGGNTLDETRSSA